MRNENVRYKKNQIELLELKNIWNEKFTGLGNSWVNITEDHERTNIAIGTIQSKAKKKDGGGKERGRRAMACESQTI